MENKNRKKMKISYEPSGTFNYHNSPAIKLIISGEDESIYGHVDAYIISAYQAKKINKHFCGIRGCQCPQGGTIDMGSNHAILKKFCL